MKGQSSLPYELASSSFFYLLVLGKYFVKEMSKEQRKFPKKLMVKNDIGTDLNFIPLFIFLNVMGLLC